MNLPVFQVAKAKSISEFVDFWSNFYQDKNEILYSDNINNPNISPLQLKNLFLWKNGSILSAKKMDSFDKKILIHIDFIRYNKNKDNIINLFNEKFKDVSAVWKIFTLHIISPNIYPIYDQNIHRAYNFIHNLPYTNINEKMSNKYKEEFYFKTYLDFVKSLNYNNQKKLDEALFSLGKLLKTYKL